MTRLPIPRPSKNSFNPERPLNSNLKAQLRQFQEVESTWPYVLRTGVDVSRIKTERDAAEYIRQMTEKMVGGFGDSRLEDLRSRDAEATSEHPSLRMLADLPLLDDASDQLGFRPFVDAMSGVIDSPNTTTPLVMSIDAPWGAGKTSLGRLIKRRLDRSWQRHSTVWFDAWVHDDAPSLATALAAAVAEGANRHRPLWRRFASPLPSALIAAKARRTRKALRYLGLPILALVLVTSIALRLGYSLSDAVSLDPRVVKGVASGLGGAYAVAIAVAGILLFKGLSAVFPIAKSVADFVKDPQAAANTAAMKDVGKQLGKLVRQATRRGGRFVVFVDNLDRCRPPTAVDALEAINQLLDHHDLVVVVMADMRAIVKCVELKYKDLAEPYYGWQYLQKIVQLQFDLPAYPAKSIFGMLKGLAKKTSTPLAPEPSGIRGLLANSKTGIAIATWIGRRRAARRRREIEALLSGAKATTSGGTFKEFESAIMDSRPEWRSDPVTSSAVHETILMHLDDDSEIQREAEDEVMQHLQPVPRHAKRLLNRLRLLLFIAHAKSMLGGTPALSPRHLAKWAVLCERWPDLAHSLVTDPDAIKGYEKLAGGTGYPADHSGITVPDRCDPELNKFMSSGVRLSSVLSRIVRFQSFDET